MYTIQLERNRKYIDRTTEALELVKRFLVLSPLFISSFICQHYSRPTEFPGYLDIVIQFSSGVGITLLDFTPLPNVSLFIIMLIAVLIDNNYLFTSLHEYFVYGISWVISSKLLDYEDSQRLFPGLALLQNSSYYISIYINNKYWLIIPYFIIFGYRVYFHSWKDKESILNISKNTNIWWFVVMSLFVISYSCCFTFNTGRGILKLENVDENFELFRYFNLDYMSIKGICTFGLFFILNTSIFMNVRWRFIAILNALFICAIYGLLIKFPKINDYHFIIDTVSIGLMSYFFDPIRSSVYSIIDYGFVWNQIPINVVLKPLVSSLVRYVDIYSMYIFPFCVALYLYITSLINKEFSELLL